MYFVNIRGKVLRAAYDRQNYAASVWKKSGELNQKWNVVYTDEHPADPKDGDYIKEWGFHINRDFYLVSALAGRKYAEVINSRQIAIKTPNGRTFQKFYFHWPSRTIRSR